MDLVSTTWRLLIHSPTEEKECLRNMFSTNISVLYAWEHSFHFYFHDNLWHYHESGYLYGRTMRFILLLLNTSTTSLGEKVNTNDYLLIENFYHSWNTFYDEEIWRMMQTTRMYEMKPDTIQFISHSLRTRVGDSCEFNFEFAKAFAESMEDYYQKLLYEAIMSYPQSDWLGIFSVRKYKSYMRRLFIIQWEK